MIVNIVCSTHWKPVISERPWERGKDAAKDAAMEGKGRALGSKPRAESHARHWFCQGPVALQVVVYHSLEALPAPCGQERGLFILMYVSFALDVKYSSVSYTSSPVTCPLPGAVLLFVPSCDCPCI